MKMPNMRYGDRDEFAFYAQGRTAKELARMLRRSERSVSDWMSGKQRMPWWVPELMRLRALEARERHREMGFAPLRQKLGIVIADTIDFPTKSETKNEKQAHVRIFPGPGADGVRIKQAR